MKKCSCVLLYFWTVNKSVFDDEVESGLILIAYDNHVRAWFDAEFANGKVEIGEVKCAWSGEDGNIFHFCLFKRSQFNLLLRQPTPHEGPMAQSGDTVEHSLKGHNCFDVRLLACILNCDTTRDTCRT